MALSKGSKFTSSVKSPLWHNRKVSWPLTLSFRFCFSSFGHGAKYNKNGAKKKTKERSHTLLLVTAVVVIIPIEEGRRIQFGHASSDASVVATSFVGVTAAIPVRTTHFDPT